MSKRHLEHFANVLDKKFKGECAEERDYNAVADELQRLTGRDTLYVGPNAFVNMQRDLVAARKKFKPSPAEAQCSTTTAERQLQDRKETMSKRFAECSQDHLRQHAKEWMTLKTKEIHHTESRADKPVTCRGCGKRVCSHLADYVCSSVPVCQWCDTYGQPNPFNPINHTYLSVCVLLRMTDVMAALACKDNNVTICENS